MKRPDVGRSDGTGTLTATIYDKAESTSAVFPFVVKAIQASELEQPAKESLELYLDQLQDNEKLYGDLNSFRRSEARLQFDIYKLHKRDNYAGLFWRKLSKRVRNGSWG